MPTSNEHQKLVDVLVRSLINEGYIIDSADSGKYPRPEKVERHEPDIMARAANGLIIIGEAKTKEDINGEISKEQFLDFSNRIMANGQLKGQTVPFHIIVKQDALEDLKIVLTSLGLSNKIGNIITIWTL